MAVVKNEAYGHGLIPVCEHLKDQVDWFCVARTEEGVKMREAGIENPILVFEVPCEENIRDFNTHDLTATISDLAHFDLLEEGTQCHMNFDTGMTRLGIRAEDVSQAVQKFDDNKQLNITGIYTHFSDADAPQKPATKEQLSLFNKIRSQFPAILYTHVSNSGGIFYHDSKETAFNGVRAGISLYGYEAGEQPIPELQPVMELKSSLVQVKKIQKGDAVGYGGRWIAEEEGWLGIIPVGYAHGVPRPLSGQIKVQIKNRLYPQKGTISMDYMTVFLGDDKLEEGTSLTLLGDNPISAKTWARILGTIPYEIITTIPQFVAREYVN